MEQELIDKKQAVEQMLQERGIQSLVNMHEVADGQLFLIDGSDQLKDGNPVSFRIVLDANPFTTGRIAFYQLAPDDNREEVLEKINLLNEQITMSKVFLSSDNMVMLEFTYTTLNEHFSAEILFNILTSQLNLIDDSIMSRLLHRVEH